MFYIITLSSSVDELPSKLQNTVSNARNATRRVKGRKEGWSRRVDSVGFYAHSKKFGQNGGTSLGIKKVASSDAR